MENIVLGSILNYLLYFGSTVVMLLIAGFVYVRFTPSDGQRTNPMNQCETAAYLASLLRFHLGRARHIREIALIRRGNAAAAVALGGAMLGYACVVYSATAHGSTLLETAMASTKGSHKLARLGLRTAYAAGHIPGAISFPHREMSAETTAGLDRSKVYVVYCDGIGCNAKELLGGLDWWSRDGHPVMTSLEPGRLHAAAE